MKLLKELKAAFTHDLPIEVLEIREEGHKTDSGKRYTMIHGRYKPLSCDVKEKERTASFWADSGGLQLKKIKPDNQLTQSAGKDCDTFSYLDPQQMKNIPIDAANRNVACKDKADFDTGDQVLCEITWL